jgi:cell division protein FtsL
MKKTKQPIISIRDRLFLFAILAIFLMIPISSVYMKAILSETNIELEKLKTNINTQKKTNEGLRMEINELASLDKIQSVATEHGLSYNNDNVKVVEESKED